MDSRWLGVVILIIILGIGGWYVFSHPVTPAPSTTTTEQATTTVATSNMPLAPVTVTYTDTGFSPASVTVAEGQSVMWVNQSSGQMWVASDPHPSHTGYDGTSRTAHCVAGYTGAAPFDECANGNSGESFTFTFTKSGSFGYHNHSDHGMTGTVIVTAAPAPSTTSTSTSTSVKVNVY